MSRAIYIRLGFIDEKTKFDDRGPDVQSIVSLQKSLVSDSLSLTVRLKSSGAHIFAEKLWLTFVMQTFLRFFTKMLLHFCVCLKTVSLTNDVVCFEQLGRPELCL